MALNGILQMEYESFPRPLSIGAKIGPISTFLEHTPILQLRLSDRTSSGKTGSATLDVILNLYYG